LRNDDQRTHASCMRVKGKDDPQHDKDELNLLPVTDVNPGPPRAIYTCLGSGPRNDVRCMMGCYFQDKHKDDGSSQIEKTGHGTVP
jgi:hypothetical protein